MDLDRQVTIQTPILATVEQQPIAAAQTSELVSARQSQSSEELPWSAFWGPLPGIGGPGGSSNENRALPDVTDPPFRSFVVGEELNATRMMVTTLPAPNPFPDGNDRVHQ